MKFQLYPTSGNLEVSYVDSGTENSETVIHRKDKRLSLLYKAIKEGELKRKVIVDILKDKSLVNVALKTTGPLAGYTSLHVACMKNFTSLVELLVNEYHADVNVEAEDGIRPIHLACFFSGSVIVELLAKSKADLDVEFTQDAYFKCVKNRRWSDDFGGTMTILTYSILNRKDYLTRLLIDYGANTKIKSLTNKTLLMYALKHSCMYASLLIKKNKDDQKYLNARNDDNYAAIHYLLHPKNYGNFRYNSKYLGANNCNLPVILRCFSKSSGIDISATVDGDPNTFLLNMAAYRSSPVILKELLPHYDFIKKSKALYYATLPVDDDLEKEICMDAGDKRKISYLVGRLRRQRNECIYLIIEDLVNRQSFKLPVPESELKLMDQVLADNPDFKEIVQDYEQNFINGALKNSKLIRYNDKTMTLYDLIFLSVNQKKLRLFVQNKTFMDDYNRAAFHVASHDWIYFSNQLNVRMKKATKRVELLNELKRISNLRKAIPLPFELIYEIIEYFNNIDLKLFIAAFVK